MDYVVYQSVVGVLQKSLSQYVQRVLLPIL
jgi:hypothetical protein